MPELTLKAIEDLLDLKLDEKLDAKLAPIQKTLNQHTSQLDNIGKDVKLLLDERLVTTHRIERVESAVKELASKAGLKLDW